MKSQMKPLHEMIREFEPLSHWASTEYERCEVLYSSKSEALEMAWGNEESNIRAVVDRESFEKMREVALILAEVSEITLEYLEPRLEHKHGSKGKTVILPHIKTSIIEARKLLGEK